MQTCPSGLKGPLDINDGSMSTSGFVQHPDFLDCHKFSTSHETTEEESASFLNLWFESDYKMPDVPLMYSIGITSVLVIAFITVKKRQG